MTNTPNQSREYDVVLGGKVPPPVDSMVLGGLDGVKRRLASVVVEQRIVALSEALKYGQSGLEIVIQALKDELWQVQQLAYSLLLDRTEPSVQQALQEYLSVDVGYTLLGDLLIARKWQEANQETKAAMLQVVNQKQEEDLWYGSDGVAHVQVYVRTSEGSLTVEQIEKFPCKDLLTINHLWVKSSNGRFGFTVQNHIWQSIGGTYIYDYEAESRFSEYVGWNRGGSLVRPNGDYLPTIINTPIGHLPYWYGFLPFHALASRFAECEL